MKASIISWIEFCIRRIRRLGLELTTRSILHALTNQLKIRDLRIQKLLGWHSLTKSANERVSSHPQLTTELRGKAKRRLAISPGIWIKRWAPYPTSHSSASRLLAPIGINRLTLTKSSQESVICKMIRIYRGCQLFWKITYRRQISTSPISTKWVKNRLVQDNLRQKTKRSFSWTII